MSIEKVREFLKERGMADRIKEFPVSSATVALAAQALGCEPERIAKTLAFNLNGECVLVVAAGDAKVDNQKFKQYFNTKAKMFPFDEVAEICGHAAGGVCPFAVKEGVKIYLDLSLKRFTTVFPAAGSSNSAIELSIDELQSLCDYIDWIDVCKLPE